MAAVPMRDLFAADPARFGRFSLQVARLLLDYSKKPHQRRNHASAGAAGRRG